MPSQPSLKHVPETPAIPDRLYFKIGDVARICGVETYVLRFWETQFPQLKPHKSGTGQRLYRRREVETALEIKRLVHQEGYTIAGARQVFEQEHRRSEPQPNLPQTDKAKERDGQSERVAATIGRARSELREIAGLLAAPVSEPAVAPPSRRAKVTAIAPSSELLFPS